VEVLPAQLGVRNFIPDASAIVADLDSLGPPTATVCPTSHLDLAVVDNNVFVDRGHDCTSYRHGLDTEAIAVRGVVLSDLGCVVKVLFHLDWRLGRIFDDVDPGKPLAASGADVAHDNHAKRRAMDSRKSLAIHLPRKHDFVDLHLPDGHADGVVVDVSLLEVRVGAEEFDVIAILFQATTVLDDLLQANTHIASGSNGTFSPGCVDQLVAITGVEADLLNTACATALECDGSGHAWELGLILELRKSNLLGVVDKTLDFEKVLLGVDFRDAAMVADVMVLVVCNFGLSSQSKDNHSQGATCLN
jgi:hypothetical protein